MLDAAFKIPKTNKLPENPISKSASYTGRRAVAPATSQRATQRHGENYRSSTGRHEARRGRSRSPQPKYLTCYQRSVGQGKHTHRQRSPQGRVWQRRTEFSTSRHRHQRRSPSRRSGERFPPNYPSRRSPLRGQPPHRNNASRTTSNCRYQKSPPTIVDKRRLETAATGRLRPQSPIVKGDARNRRPDSDQRIVVSYSDRLFKLDGPRDPWPPYHRVSNETLRALPKEDPRRLIVLLRRPSLAEPAPPPLIDSSF